MKFSSRNLRVTLFPVMMFGLVACNQEKAENSSICPQSRDTDLAPAHIASLQNPLQINEENLSAGRALYHSDVKPVACSRCHGAKGGGNGEMANMFSPEPRNFSCDTTMQTIPDGQLFWVIQNGSLGTSMPSFEKLSEDEIWQLVLYIRSFTSGPVDRQG